MFVEMVDTELEKEDDAEADRLLIPYRDLSTLALRLRSSWIFANCSSATPFLAFVSFNI